MRMMERMTDYVVLVDNKLGSIITFLRRAGRGTSNNQYMDMLRRESSSWFSVFGIDTLSFGITQKLVV